MKTTEKFNAMNLELISIHRQSLIDADYIGCCDHCGRPIVNIAVVKNKDTGEQFDIGLDCKKTLIDKPVLSKMTDKHEIKDYKAQTSRVQKFLLYLSQPERYEVTTDNKTLYVNDLQKELFAGSGMFGACIDSENLSYLFYIGMKDFLLECVNKNLITYQR